MPFPQIDPIAIAIGPFAVRWYALAYLFGIALAIGTGMLMLRNQNIWPKSKPPFTPAQYMDFGFWAVLGVIIGGRLGYVLFYNPAHYLTHINEIPAIWQGGMAFHGGLLGVIVTMVLFARHHKAKLLSAFDLLGMTAPIGLFLGRLSNFINAELYGRPTDLPWGVIFPNTDGLPRHPSQLYEAALEGVLLFAVLLILARFFGALHRPGLIAGLFGIGYGLARLAVEFVRLPDAHIGYLTGGWLTLGMLLTLPLLVAGGALVSLALRAPPQGKA